MVGNSVRKEDYDRPREAYLGWYLAGELSAGSGGTYIWYADEDRGTGQFAVSVKGPREGDYDAQIKSALNRGRSICRGKIFLSSWEQGARYLAPPPVPKSLPTPEIRRALTCGLHRLYEAGFDEGDFKVDLRGVADELETEYVLVLRAADHLIAQGLVAKNPPNSQLSFLATIWLTPEGVAEAEALAAPSVGLLTDVYSRAKGRLDLLSPTLGRDFERLVSSGSKSTYSRNELIAIGAGVRDLLQDLTDRLVAIQGTEGSFSREQTKLKVAALVQHMQSKRLREHTVSVADVLEVYWNRLEGVIQSGVHQGEIEAPRLLAYVVLFVADLMGIALGE
jgi:hypothetical protein